MIVFTSLLELISKESQVVVLDENAKKKRVQANFQIVIQECRGRHRSIEQE